MAGLVNRRSIPGTVSGSLGRRPEFQVYKSSSHNSSILTALGELRQEKTFCDVSLIVEDQSFSAHKNILAAASSYLKELFLSDEDTKEFEIADVTSEGIHIIINYVYSAEIQISMKNIHCILSAAGVLQIKSIINFCKAFLIAEISVYNCVDIIHIAEDYKLPSVEEKAYNFIAQHLNELVKTEEIQKLSIDNMSLLLDSYTLKNVSELELFEASRQWLLKTTDRYRHVRQLMEKIHFPLIPPRDLLRYVNFVEFMRVECNFLLLEASNYHMLPHSQPILQSVRTQVRSTDSRMVVIGGVDPHDRVSNQLYAINGDLSRSEFLPPMHEGLCSHCACVMNNFLYVLGGQNMFDERGTTAVNTVIRYDPRFNIWMRIAAMNDKRAGFTVSVVDNRIYALGGVNAAGRMSSMECYSLDDDRWRYVASVQTGLCDHAQAIQGNLIYISGGFKEGRFTNQLLAYSPRHDTWHERTPMHSPRGWHAMVGYGDNSIFVTGGNAGLNKRVDVLETEIYNVMTDQWTVVAPLPQPHSEGGCEFYDDKIFIVGGYSWAQQKCLSLLQYYEPAKDTWFIAGNIPIELSGVRLATLTIPYSVSAKSGLVTGSHVPLSWPGRPTNMIPDQDPRFLTGNSFLGSNASSNQYYPGFMDPFIMSDVRDAFSDFSSRPTSSIARPNDRIVSSQSSHLNDEIRNDRMGEHLYSRPRRINMENSLIETERNPKENKERSLSETNDEVKQATEDGQ